MKTRYIETNALVAILRNIEVLVLTIRKRSWVHQRRFLGATLVIRVHAPQDIKKAPTRFQQYTKSYLPLLGRDQAKQTFSIRTALWCQQMASIISNTWSTVAFHQELAPA